MMEQAPCPRGLALTGAILLSLLGFASSASVLLSAAKILITPQGDGSFGSISDTFYAASVLSIAKDEAWDAAATCAWLSTGVSEDSLTFPSASFAARLAALSCKTPPSFVKAVEKFLLRSSASAASVREAHLAAAALASLKEVGWAEETAEEYSRALGPLTQLLEGLKDGDGTWRLSEGAPSSPLAAGYALRTVASLAALGSLKESKAKSILASGRSLLAALVTGEGGEMFFEGSPEGGSALQATAVTVSGLLALPAAFREAFQVKRETVAGLAAYIAAAGAPLSLEEASDAAEAVKALSKNDIAIPVLLHVPGHYSTSSNAPLVVSLRTPLGLPAAGASLRIVSARLESRTAGTRRLVSSPEVLQPLPDDAASFALPQSTLGADTALGLYSFKFEVGTDGVSRVALSPITRHVSVTAAISISPVSVAVLDSLQGQPEAEALVDVAAGSGSRALSATHLQKLRVKVSLTTPSGQPYTPDQALLSLRHAEAAVEHTWLLKPGNGSLTMHLDFLESLEKLHYLSGLYSLGLTIGGSFMENSGTWALGSVDLDLPEAPEGAPQPPAKPRSLEERFGPKAEIEHIFRKPERRPPLAVSYAFTALTALPLLAFAGGLSVLGVNLRLLPRSGLPLLSALGFHAGIASILALYFAFWLEVKLFTTLKLLCLMALLTSLPGHAILSFLADSTAKMKGA